MDIDERGGLKLRPQTGDDWLSEVEWSQFNCSSGVTSSCALVCSINVLNIEEAIWKAKKLLMMNFQQSKKIKRMRLLLVVMDDFYQSRDFATVGKLFLKIDLQFWAIDTKLFGSSRKKDE